MTRFWMLGCLGLLALPAPAASATDLLLAEKGKSAYVIAVPNGPDEHGRLKWAVDLLQSTLAGAVGVKLPVVKEGDLAAGRPAIYLGRTRAAKRAGLRLEDLQGWAFLKEVKGNDLFLAGQDSGYEVPGPYEGLRRRRLRVPRNAQSGDLLPGGRSGRAIPAAHEKRAAHSQAKPLDGETQPQGLPLPHAGLCHARDAGDDLYQVANNFVMSNFTKSYSGHSYNIAVPAEKYGTSHPEYFALIGGVRKTQGNHVCISNQAVEDLIGRGAEAAVRQGLPVRRGERGRRARAVPVP